MIVYRFGDYHSRYVEVVRNEECGKEGFVFNFDKVVEETFTGCNSEVAVMRGGRTLLSLEYRPFISRKLCVEIKPYGESEYSYIACLGEKKPQYVEGKNSFIITESYDEGLIVRIADLFHAVYNLGTLEDKVVQRNALDLFLFELPSIWDTGYIPIEEINKKTVHLYRKERRDSIVVNYAFFLSFVIIKVLGKIYIGNLPFSYVVNPGESQHLGELDRITVKNINSFDE